MDPFLRSVLDIAQRQIGVREKGGKNRGPEVDEYLRAAGMDPTTGAWPWCMAFVYWCFEEAANLAHVHNPCPRTASTIRLWDRASDHQVAAPEPGCLVVWDHGHGKGHVGIVDIAGTEFLTTVEGNTNRDGSREGDSVWLKRRPVADTAIKGYLLLKPKT